MTESSAAQWYRHSESRRPDVPSAAEKGTEGWTGEHLAGQPVGSGWWGEEGQGVPGHLWSQDRQDTAVLLGGWLLRERALGRAVVKGILPLMSSWEPSQCRRSNVLSVN